MRVEEMKLLAGQTETIELQEMRKRIGDAITQVQMGKTYIITKYGKPVAVLKAMEAPRA